MIGGANGVDVVGDFLRRGSGSGLERMTPEPEGRLLQGFRQVLHTAASTLDAFPLVGGGLGEIDPLYTDLINQQIAVQQQLQLVSFESNIEKSKHETQMAAVRNIRVG